MFEYRGFAGGENLDGNVAAAMARMDRHQLPIVCPGCHKYKPEWNISSHAVFSLDKDRFNNVDGGAIVHVECGYDIAAVIPEVAGRYLHRVILGKTSKPIEYRLRHE